MKPIYKLVDWLHIPSKYTNDDEADDEYSYDDCDECWLGLMYNTNPKAFEIILDLIKKDEICFEYHNDFDYIDFIRAFASHPDAADYIIENIDKPHGWKEDRDGDVYESPLSEIIRCDYMCANNDNSNLLKLFEKRPDLIHWSELCCNSNPKLLALIEDNIDKFDLEVQYGDNNSNNSQKNILHVLSENPYAIHLLKKIGLYCPTLIARNPHPEAFEILEKVRKQVDWSDEYLWSKHYHYPDENFSYNNLIRIVEKYYDEMKDIVPWDTISMNPHLITLLINHKEKIMWSPFSRNNHPMAIELLKQNQDKIDWNLLCWNTCSKAIELLQQNQDKINWKYLSSNSHNGAIEFLEKNVNNIDWNDLIMYNKNPRAIDLLMNHWYDGILSDKTAWRKLTKNPYAIPLLERLNKSDVEYEYFYGVDLYSNPGIFKLDTEAMKKQIASFAEELMAAVFHPRRVQYFLDKYNYDITCDEYRFDD